MPTPKHSRGYTARSLLPAVMLEFPGGSEALAQRMSPKLSGASLRAKCNPNVSAGRSHHLTLIEAVRMQAISGRHDILRAMAIELGEVTMPSGRDGYTTDEVARALPSACAEFGEYMAEVGKALRDGVISTNERRRLERALVEVVSACGALQASLNQKAR